MGASLWITPAERTRSGYRVLVTLRRRRTSPLAILSALALSGAALVGCTPEAKPTPTPTAAFASEEEAFAAAEEVYRAYNDATATPDADPSVFLTATALEDYLDGEEYYSASGLTMEGPTKVLSFEFETADIGSRIGTISSEICIDISSSRVIDSTGTDVTPADRASLWRLAVSFTGDSTKLLIASSRGEEDPSCSAT